MATGIDVSGLTLNPEEIRNVGEFIVEELFDRPRLNALHTVYTGVKMKEQIVLAGQFGKMGIKGDSTCTRKESGASSALTQKYWDPQGIEDTLVHCQAEINSLFKAYYSKITKYIEEYEIEGSEIQVFMSMLILESMDATAWRAIWFGDSAVAVSGVGIPGLKLAANVKFYDYFDGIWKQIFAAAALDPTRRVTIAENSDISKPLQLTLAAGRSVEIFDAIKVAADSRLRASMDAQLYVSREIFDNYTAYLKTKGENFTIDYTTEGMQTVKWDGYNVVNMETIWDIDAREDFEDGSATNLYDRPNRVVFTTPSNIPVATLSENDLTALEVFYDRKPRELNTAFGFSLDAKLLQDYLFIAAY